MSKSPPKREVELVSGGPLGSAFAVSSFFQAEPRTKPPPDPRRPVGFCSALLGVPPKLDPTSIAEVNDALGVVVAFPNVLVLSFGFPNTLSLLPWTADVAASPGALAKAANPPLVAGPDVEGALYTGPVVVLPRFDPVRIPRPPDWPKTLVGAVGDAVEAVPHGEGRFPSPPDAPNAVGWDGVAKDGFPKLGAAPNAAVFVDPPQGDCWEPR